MQTNELQESEIMAKTDDLTKENTVTIGAFVWDTKGLYDEESPWKSGNVIVKISDLESLGFTKEKQDQCADCPGRTMPMPFTCHIPESAQDVIGQHSGAENKMEIMITKCHHKARVTKAAPQNRDIIEEANKIVEEQRASERASAEKRETAERLEANKSEE